MKIVAAFLPLVLLSCATSIDSPEQLIRSMKDTHGGSYINTLTFTQKTVNVLPDQSRREETWYEAMRIPGALSIRFDPVDSGRGIIFVHDSLFVMQDGARRIARDMIHPLLVLGFDVYVSPPEDIVAKLEQLGYDLASMHETTWQDRPVYVVGAAAGDDSTKQFWIDKERLVFVRSLDINPFNGVRMEVQFNNYEKVDGVWISPEVLFLRDGNVVTEEYYTDIRTNVAIDDREFDSDQWMYVQDKK